jgi:formylglycine-generating enzyme required for sulfatase activity
LQAECARFAALWDSYGFGYAASVLAAGILLLILYYFFQGILKGSEEAGKGFFGRLAQPMLRFIADIRYLTNFIAKHRLFGFRGIETMAVSKLDLDNAYIPLELTFESERTRKGDALEGITVLPREGGGAKPVSIAQVLEKQSKVTIIGDAGSGKSALLQWLGLTAARYLFFRRLSQEQRRAAAALRLNHLLKPLFPVIIPLREYNAYCKDKQLPRSADTLYQYLERLPELSFKGLRLPADFFTRLMRRGCLLMLDGVDEVDDEHRQAVREAVEGLVCLPGNRRSSVYLVTTRPSAASVAAQLADFHQASVNPLSPDQRRSMVRVWSQAVNPTIDEAEDEYGRLMERIETEPIVSIATTPLMVNIVALVFHNKKRLPSQRAELYELALEALITEVHRSGQAMADATHWHGMNWRQRRDSLALVAFILHDESLESIQTSNLLEKERFWRRFGDNREKACLAASEFLERTAGRGGLLRQDGVRYDFYIRRFREFLAGRYLAASLEDEWEQRLARYYQDDQWEEPILLAAGFLAFDNPEKAVKFMRLLAKLGAPPENMPEAIALSGVALADLLDMQDQQVSNLFRPQTAGLPEKMLAVFRRDPPKLRFALRHRLGLALGELGDPRFQPTPSPTTGELIILPDLVPAPAGAYRQGTSDDDKAKLQEQNASSWEDEEPSHTIQLQAFAIGRCPVTNAEFRSFWLAQGYQRQEFWSQEGWRWRTGDWQPDLSVYPGEYRENFQKWLEGRPLDKRSQPFFWEQPRWSASNLPVVGVTWFEAEAYINWLNALSGRIYRLPSEAEWEAAARGPQGWLWPWGNEWDAERCNSAEGPLSSTSPVGLYPQGASSCRALDMIGNVWEWCQDGYYADAYTRRLKAGGAPGNQPAPPAAARVVRGGSWGSNRNLARGAYRPGLVPDYFDNTLGFRLALSPGKPLES